MYRTCELIERAAQEEKSLTVACSPVDQFETTARAVMKGAHLLMHDLKVGLTDARFSGRCNGADLRLGFSHPDTEPVIAEVLVKSLR